jgi:hypothetical protein
LFVLFLSFQEIIFTQDESQKYVLLLKIHLGTRKEKKESGKETIPGLGNFHALNTVKQILC